MNTSNENYTSVRILPCPFCGIVDSYTDKERPSHTFTRCYGCGAQGPQANLNAGEDCDALWNKRHV